MRGGHCFLKLICGTSFLVPLISNTPAYANDSRLEEIIVTARKQQEGIQDTPVAVTALSSGSLEDRSISTIRDVAQFVPGTLATPGPEANGNASYFYIRGVGQEDNAITRDPGVGIYIDGIYIGRTQGAAFDNLGIERIEILRGPQGTLFGRNNIGGALNIITERPGDEFKGQVEATVGERDRYDVKTSLQFPLVEGVLSGSVSAMARTQDGYGKRVVDGRTMGDIGILSQRSKLLWHGADSMEAQVSFDYTRSRGTAVPQYTVGTQTISQGGFTPFGVPIPDDAALQACPKRVCYLSYSSVDPRTAADTYGTSMTLDWNIGDAYLKSITAYRGIKSTDGRDYDATSYLIADDVIHIKQHQLSQELQLSGKDLWKTLDWITGVYYFDEHADQRAYLVFGSSENKLDPSTALNAKSIASASHLETDAASAGIYGQFTAHLNDQWSLTLGGRYTHEKKKIKYDLAIDNRTGGGSLSLFPYFQSLPEALIPTIIAPKHNSWNPMTWRIGTEYKANEDILLYASAASGFRGGGFNSRPTSEIEATSFDPEKLITYEIGLKSEFFDNFARLNIAAFHTDYKDIQIIVQQGVVLAIANAGEAKIDGLEAELSTASYHGFKFNLSGSYMDAKYADDIGPVDTDGNIIPKESKLALSPKWTLIAGAEKTFDLNENGMLTVRADYSYKTKYFLLGNPFISAKQPSYGILNLRATYQPEDGNWSVAAYGTNVTNTNYITYGESTFGLQTRVAAPKSEFGVEMRLNF